KKPSQIVTWIASVLATVSIQAETPEPAAAEVFGIPIEDDVLFIIDASAEMNRPFGLHSRFTVATDEIAAAIEALPEDIRFNVAAVDEGVHWVDGQYQLVNATPEIKEALTTVVKDLDTGKGSNFELALAAPIVFSPRPKQVVLISASKPEDLSHLDEIKQLADADIRVDCVGIKLNSAGAGAMREIAHPTGGKFVYADEPVVPSAAEKKRESVE
ncbi:MAG: vWA domain-containing protein, partial [Verrucomicrobiota bacterium]